MILRLFKSLFLLLFFLAIGVFALVLGFQVTFPGETLSQYAEQQLAAMGVQTDIAPVELVDVRSVNVRRVALLAPPSIPVNDLFVVDDLKLALLPQILDQHLHITGQAYDGGFSTNLAILNPKSVDFEINNVVLDRIPAVNVQPFAFIKGTVTASGIITNLNQLQTRRTQIPKGSLNVILSDLQITPKDLSEAFKSMNLGGVIGDLKLPGLAFSKIMVDLESGDQLNIRRIDLDGSIQGTIDGQITLNQRNIVASRIQLHIRVTFAEELEKELGPMSFILKGFKCGNVIDIDVSGTLRGFNPPKRRQCS